MRNIAYLLFLVAALTASFDLIGILPVGGGNLRLTNLAMIALSAIGVVWSFRKLPRVHGFLWLLAWTLANAACVANAPQNFRTYAYLVWLCVDVAFIFATTAVFAGEAGARNIARLNFWIYALIAGAGLLQFILFACGLDVLVAQVWTARFPRINGFSYEPSYYATYLIVGWAMSFYLGLKPQTFIRPAFVWFVFALETIALLLCTSRMGYVAMAVLLIIMAPKIAKRFTASGSFSLAILAGVGASAAVLALLAVGNLRGNDYLFLLEGTGIGGTTAHSRDARLEEFQQYKDLFLAHPFKGYSLGGTTGVLAGAGKGEILDYDDMRQAQGINVSMEIILAAGLLAAPLFFIYLYQITVSPLRRFFSAADEGLVAVTKANICGLLLQFFLLQFNQNILRNYFWIQIAVVSCLVTEIRRQQREAALVENE